MPADEEEVHGSWAQWGLCFTLKERPTVKPDLKASYVIWCYLSPSERNNSFTAHQCNFGRAQARRSKTDMTPLLWESCLKSQVICALWHFVYIWFDVQTKMDWSRNFSWYSKNIEQTISSVFYGILTYSNCKSAQICDDLPGGKQSDFEWKLCRGCKCPISASRHLRGLSR